VIKLPAGSCLALLLILPAVVVAQGRVVDHNAHAWGAYFGDHPLGDSRWGLHLEGQYRRHEYGRQWQQLLLRPGVNYSAGSHLLLTAGYAYARSFSYSDYVARRAPTNEHRIWEQAWLRYRSGSAAWTTRLRFEHRFLENRSAPQSGYRYEHRLRAWQQVTLPLVRKTYVTGYDEAWFYVPPYTSDAPFDQNRAYAGVGLRLNPSWRLEAAYMNQAILHRSGPVLESNHTLVLSLFSSARFGSH
jgi:hypothetical protein